MSAKQILLQSGLPLISGSVLVSLVSVTLDPSGQEILSLAPAVCGDLSQGPRAWFHVLGKVRG